jgi:hypothetical protein
MGELKNRHELHFARLREGVKKDIIAPAVAAGVSKKTQ